MAATFAVAIGAIALTAKQAQAQERGERRGFPEPSRGEPVQVDPLFGGGFQPLPGGLLPPGGAFQPFAGFRPFAGGNPFFDDPVDPFDDPFTDPFSGQDDPFRNDGNNGSQNIQITRIQLQGQGCPDQNSVQVFLRRTQNQNGQPRDVLNIAFPGSNNNRVQTNRFFQVDGPIQVRTSCNTMVQLQVNRNNNRPLQFQLRRAQARVLSINNGNRGQLVVRSQFRLNDQMSEPQAFQLSNTQQAQESNVNFNDLNLNTRIGAMNILNRVNLMTSVDLQRNGIGNNGAVRLEEINLQFRVRSNNRNGNN